MAESQQRKNVSDVIDLQRPFPGLQSFQEKNKAQFGGRDTEIRELFEMVQGKPLTVVFGKSGIGKTSLLLAGLLPELQKNFYLPIYTRIDFAAAKAPLLQLKDFIYEKVSSQDKSAPQFGTQTLWEYFHDVKLLDGMLTPVLILDQFEEIFTLGKDNSRGVFELIIELSDLIENRVPLVVQEGYQQRTEMISSNYGTQHYRVVISLREDYLAQLESLKRYIPSLKNNRYRVVQMTVLQAMDAAIKPGKGLIEKEIAAHIIKKLPNVTDRDFDPTAEEQDGVKRLLVEPFLLSLICFQMNEKRIALGLEKITFDLVSQFEVSDIINSYYDDVMKNFDTMVRHGIEDELLTESGYRKLETFETLKQHYKIDETILQTLIDKRIVRKEERDGIDYVELIHDVLTPVIKQKRDARQKEIYEKERSEGLKRAIELDRVRRKKYVYWVVGLLLAAIFSSNSYHLFKHKREIERFKNIDSAKNLLVVAKYASEINGELEHAAMISRTAYLIHKENKGLDNTTFYVDLQERCEALGIDFNYSNYSNYSVETTDYSVESSVKGIAFAGDNVFSGYWNGKLIRSEWNETVIQAQQLEMYDFEKKVYCIASNNDHSYLAAGGNFNYIELFNIEHNLDTTRLNSDLISLDSKSLCFTEDNKLLLRNGSTLLGWEDIKKSLKPLYWGHKSLFTLKDGNYQIEKNKLRIDSTSLSIDDIEFNCMAVFENDIAIGIDSGLVLFKGDSLVKIEYPEIGESSSIQFDKTGNFLYIGNETGMVYRINLTNYNIEKNQHQIARIGSIVTSSDGKYLATASYDGSIGIYTINSQKKWNENSFLIFELNNCEQIQIHEQATCIAFTEDDQFLLAGYTSGTIRKWPVSCDILSSMICNKVSTNLDLDTIFAKYSLKPLSKEESKKYKCTTIKK